MTNMYRPIDSRREWTIWAVLLVPILLLLLLWNELPAQLPSHWNLRGEVDGYSAKWVLPLLGLPIYALLAGLPLLDPKRHNYQFFNRAYFAIRLAIQLFLSTLAVAAMLVGLGHTIAMHRWIPIGVFLLIAVVGNYLTTVRPNRFMGFRTPWTLKDETNWRRTHRVGGRVWFVGGLAGVVATLLLPPSAMLTLILIITLVLVLVPLGYSWWVHQQPPRDPNNLV